MKQMNNLGKLCDMHENIRSKEIITCNFSSNYHRTLTIHFITYVTPLIDLSLVVSVMERKKSGLAMTLCGLNSIPAVSNGMGWPHQNRHAERTFNDAGVTRT